MDRYRECYQSGLYIENAWRYVRTGIGKGVRVRIWVFLVYVPSSGGAVC